MSIYDVKDKGKWGARAFLVLIPIAILIGLCFVPITDDSPIWPAPHHTTVGVILFVIIGYGALGVGALVAVVCGITWLWEKADW